MWHLGGWVSKYAIMETTYCYNWITCGCQLEIGLEAAMTRTMDVAMGPLPQGRILEHHLEVTIKCLLFCALVRIMFSPTRWFARRHLEKIVRLLSQTSQHIDADSLSVRSASAQSKGCKFSTSLVIAVRVYLETP